MSARRINIMSEKEWRQHDAYPGPVPEPSERPAHPHRWTWFGGSMEKPPAWIWIDQDQARVSIGLETRIAELLLEWMPTNLIPA